MARNGIAGSFQLLTGATLGASSTGCAFILRWRLSPTGEGLDVREPKLLQKRSGFLSVTVSGKNHGDTGCTNSRVRCTIEGTQ